MGSPIGALRFESLLTDQTSICVDADAVTNNGNVVPEVSVHLNTKGREISSNLFFTLHSSDELRRLADVLNRVAQHVDQLNEEVDYDYDEE